MPAVLLPTAAQAVDHITHTPTGDTAATCWCGYGCRCLETTLQLPKQRPHQGWALNSDSNLLHRKTHAEAVMGTWMFHTLLS